MLIPKPAAYTISDKLLLYLSPPSQSQNYEDI